ncbi:MAG TPA: site-specific integrase [Candidatus Hydrogenedentes bacterium]|nr:site-specific integrase [Candidatus Hydrogenedentota bacterium]
MSAKIPKFRHHKPTHQGYVELNNHRYYLGRYDDPKTKQRYDRTVQEWLANNRRVPVSPSEITIAEMCAAFMDHAEIHYRHPDGRPTGQMDVVTYSLKPLKAVYGDLPVIEFTPLQLKAIRAGMISSGLTRTGINKRIRVIRHVFKWAVSEGMIPVTTYQAIQCVTGLQAGRSEAVESEAVRPVPQSHIDLVRPLVSRQVRALIDLQLLCGARPAELLKLRAIDIDTSGKVWMVRLSEHKTSYRGRERCLHFGPRAQTILREFMQDRPISACLFSAREAEQQRYAACEKHRHQPVPEPMTERQIRDHYDVASYRRAIKRAVDKFNAREIAEGRKDNIIPAWSPNRLRHSFATNVRREYGLEAAQVLLGHAHADVTQIYAETNTARAIEVAAQIG